ncbi:MAG: hypothetical protein HY721_33520, partial [Planctomycetes bacterium]|nr:hypothetical protein [Planctomycetota bacterium]
GLIYVADAGNHRTMAYASAGGLASGASGAAIGQASASEGSANRGGAPGAETLSGPDAVEVAGTALVVADAGNHRVLAYEGASLPATHRDATLVLGQASFSGATPGARRLNQPADVLLVKGKLIVADTGNHRVLIYSTLTASGDPDPDVVLGQADLFSTRPDRGGDPTAATLDRPTGLATDGTRLAVADTGNHRVLLWSSIPTADGAAADVVIGQSSGTGSLPNAGGPPSARTLRAPEGLAVAEDRLIVADRDNHRVLIFDGLGTIGTFAAAATVLGQRDFDEVEPNRGAGVSRLGLARPRDVLAAAGNLYVADAGNHRVLVWDRVPRRSGAPADGLFGQPGFDAAVIAGAAPDSLVEPSGLAMDPGGELLIVADTAHDRVVFFDSVLGDRPDLRSADGVLGQRTLSSALDPGLSGPTFATLEGPRGLFFNGYELLATDSGASRLALFR